LFLTGREGAQAIGLTEAEIQLLALAAAKMLRSSSLVVSVFDVRCCMDCPACRAENRDGSKFCSQCGTVLPMPCLACGHVNEPGSRFCSQCGGKQEAPAGVRAGSAVPAVEPRNDLAAERRHLTVMFCDLVGSTALSARLDVEDLREVIGAYHTRVAEVVAGFGGYVARYMGDGVLVYFGYPKANEDDPEQSLRAGLALVDAIRDLKGPEPLAVRLGIATGLAVVGDLIGAGASQEREVVGEMPNLAARLQSLAQPNTIVIADSTRRLIGSVFDLEDLGALPMKGFTEPQRAWRVLGESGVRSRFEAFRSAETSLIGRDEEIELLMHGWEQAKAGEGRVVLVSAEPGVGKSRLSVALEERLRAEPHILLRFFCLPHHEDSVLFSIISQLERAAGLDREDTPEVKVRKLEALLAPTSPSNEDIALLAELLLLPTLLYPALDLPPQPKKERTFEAMLRHLDGLARRKPVLLIFEDLHWIDPTSRELLDLTIEYIERLPVLILATSRPEFTSPWSERPHVTTLTLSRLSRSHCEKLVRELAIDARALPKEVIEEILDRGDGIPLFLEEVTKAILELGAHTDQARGVLSKVPSPAVSVPATLQASLMARLDRLGTSAREVAQIGATIGREFSYELLAMVAQQPASELQESLGRLVEAGLVFQRGMLPRADFQFKHALVQDAAYSTLLRGPRQHLHLRIADALETTFSDIAASRPEAVARHLSEARRPERAISYWQRAGELALRRSATGEALAHFFSALRTLESLPDTLERAGPELNARLGLGTALSVARGPSHADVAENYARAVDLGRGLGDSTQLFRALWGSWYTTQVTGKGEQALVLADELVLLAQRLGDEDLMLEAYHSRWATSHTFGLNAATLADAERGMALYNPDRHHSHAYEYGGHDTGVCALAHGAMTLWVTGFPERALQRSDAALELGRRLAHPPSLAHAAWWSAALMQVLRRPEACRKLAELAIQIAHEQGSGIFVACPLLVGWAVFETGDRPKGLRLMEDRITSSRHGGRRFYYDYELLVFAEALLKAGAPDRALERIDEALEVIENNGSRLFLAECLRLRGESLNALGARASDAEACLTRAIETAGRQNALSLELRAATSLARCWRDQGRLSDARDLLAPVYGRFTEGFDTADPVDARAILNALVFPSPHR
jgi:class 3 adenylate cyclase/tetratricopeptide (TPR) repeat protein